MTRQSAGLLVYRRDRGGVEVFLVHPGGPFWKNKDTHAWSIPKGEFNDETPVDAAQREFVEETGQTVSGEFHPLAPLTTGTKTIHAFAVESATPDPERLRSNEFELEWPPRSGRTARFPEVDRAAWVPLTDARERLHRNQQDLVDQLEALLGGG
ncbi:MAG: NUDIX domain-containing protein [Pseudomonadales bacterium]